MNTTICRHIRLNGARCGSPALSGSSLCFHHSRLARHHRHLAPQPSSDDATPTVLHPIALSDHTQRNPLLAEYHRPTLVLDLPPLEDRDSIQVALSMVITAMAQQRIDPKLATSILYGLQVASANARNLSTDTPKNVVRDTVLEDGQQLAPDEDPAEDPVTPPASSFERTVVSLLERLQQPDPQPQTPDPQPDPQPDPLPGSDPLDDLPQPDILAES